MEIGELATVVTIVTAIGAGVLGYLRWRGGVILVSPDVLEALSKMQNQLTTINDELDEERQKRRTLGFDLMKTQRKLEETRQRMMALEQENSNLKDTLNMLLEWVNDREGELRDAGIDPPDVNNIQFRGE